MSRKHAKGYFVKGQFVAEGSELDLALKRELKGSDSASKTDLKRESAERQALGERLCTLRAESMQQLVAAEQVPEPLWEAIRETQKITDFEGLRRQMQFIGKLMRALEPEQVAAIEEALRVQHSGSVTQTQLLHQSEQWRDRLLLDDHAMSEWLRAFPDSDSQQLRALIRQARKDRKEPDARALSQGTWPRQSRAYRELFQLLRAQLAAATSNDQPHLHSHDS
jgi:ribosome-associated protein